MISNYKNRKRITSSGDWAFSPRRSRVARFTAGFSIIEMLVAIGLFSVVVAIAVGGFASALRTQRQAQLLLAVNSNISQALEIMAREIRTGVGFSLEEGQYSGFGFTNAKEETVLYTWQNGGLHRTAFRLAGGFPPRLLGGGGKITSDNVLITSARFEVRGTDNRDGYPPRVTIALRAQASSTDPGIASSVIDVQTTVSARLMDDDPPRLLVRKQLRNPASGEDPEDFTMVVAGDYVRPCLTPEAFVDTPGKTKQEKERDLENIMNDIENGVCKNYLSGNSSSSICLFRGSGAGTEVTLAEGSYCVDELYSTFYAKEFDRDCEVQNEGGYDAAVLNKRRVCDVINTRVSSSQP